MSIQIRKEDALNYHLAGKKGKIEIVPTKPVSTLRDLSLAYSPGVAYPCLEIAADVSKVYDYTARGNVVAVISNGTAVLGLGNIGPEASKPVMEGKAILFKKYAGIDGIDIEINETDPEAFIRVVKALEPSFGGINLEDIKAPECFEIERRLREEMNIPLMHDDQHGTAIISAAALLNALEIVNKSIGSIKMVVSGAGAAAVSCVRLYFSLGLKPENLVMCDRNGVIQVNRTDLDPIKREFATHRTDLTDLRSAFKDADVFVGLSANIVDEAMVKSMAKDPIIFALANPTPEIAYELAVAARPDCIMATGRSDYPNQVNNVLGFPYIFRGALDVRATEINEAMKLGAVRAIAELAKEPVPEEINAIYGQKLSFGKHYLIPKPMDRRLLTEVSIAVAKAAIESGVATKPIESWSEYELELLSRLGYNSSLTRTIVERAKNNPKKIVFPEGYNYKILKAAQILIDDNIAIPVLLGNKSKIEAILKHYEIDLNGVQIIDPQEENGMREHFANAFFKKRQRKGMTRQEANRLMNSRDYFGVMLLAENMVDAYLTGVTKSYPSAIKPVLEFIGLEKNAKTCVGLYILNAKSGVYFFADTTINKEPDEDTLVEIALLTARAVEFFNVQPKIAMLSYSNFGSNRDPLTQKVANATYKIKHRQPNLIVDGDIQANIALRPDLMTEYFPFNSLAQTGANTFIFPNLASANIAYKLLQELADMETIGPVLLGIDKPAHILQMGSSVREIVNMAAMAIVDAQSYNQFF